MKLKAWFVIAPMCVALAFIAPSAAQAQAPKGEPSPALKTCITSNASAVEQAIPELEDGVRFLAQNLCAAPLAEQIEAEQQAAQQQMMNEQRDRTIAMCDAMAAEPATANSPEDGGYDYMATMCSPAALEILDNDLYYTGTYALASLMGDGALNSPAATTLASQLLLKLRVERLNKKP